VNEASPRYAARPRSAAGASWLRIAVLATATLALLQILWEFWLAPLRPGGTWLVLKALPLMALWPGVARGALKPRQYLGFVLLPYVAEGMVRAFTESGRHAMVAAMAALIAAIAFAALVLSFRAERRGRSQR
jgi:uncharacterized membrane protein